MFATRAFALAVYAAAALLLATPAAAQQSKSPAHTCAVNGCGPDGFWGAVIPNELAGCKFKSACDAHDVCYAKCTPCHPYHTNARCFGIDNKLARRGECDKDFESQMVKENGGTSICRVAARAYATAVRSMGDSYHRGSRPAAVNAAEFEKVFAAEFAKLKKSVAP